MKVGIIAPIEDAEFISEHTDFDVALGYMATRYREYLRVMQSLRFMKRDIYLIQHPRYIIREDYYLTGAQRMQPKVMAPTLRDTSNEQYESYTNLIRAKNRNPELDNTIILPFINEYDDETNISAYVEISKRCFLMWNLADVVPLRIAHDAIIVGMPTLDVLHKVKPYGIITAIPIIFAKNNISIAETDEDLVTGALYQDSLEPDWFLHNLTNEALSLAVENVKELRNVVNGTGK